MQNDCPPISAHIEETILGPYMGELMSSKKGQENRWANPRSDSSSKDLLKGTSENYRNAVKRIAKMQMLWMKVAHFLTHFHLPKVDKPVEYRVGNSKHTPICSLISHTTCNFQILTFQRITVAKPSPALSATIIKSQTKFRKYALF